jgi:cysteine desulfurase family protein
MEHNSVMRVLRDLEKQGVELTVVQCSREGCLNPGDVEDAMKKNTRMVVLNCASNVVGTLLPVREVGKIAREKQCLFLVDAAQTAGCVPMDVNDDNIDLLAFSGHKGLLGPQGTGGLIIGERVNIGDMNPLKSGGTGSRSEFEHQPDFLPDRYECGTLNTVGLAGLAAGVEYVLNETVEKIRNNDMKLAERFIKGAVEIQGCSIYGPRDEKKQTSTISFSLEKLSPSEAGLMLDEKHSIMCRVGLHCAPAAHRTLGTFPEGTVRFGFGYFNSTDEVDLSLEALKEMVT